MKRIVLTLSVLLAVLPAMAQSLDTVSTVIGRKLNFEAPLFGVKVNTLPKWSLVFLGDVSIGYSHAFNVPEAYHELTWTLEAGKTRSEYVPIGLSSSGIYVDLSVLELRYRPWKNGNMFTCGFTISTDSRDLQAQALFNRNHKPAFTTAYNGAGRAKGTYSEQAYSISLGFVHEKGDWSFGFNLLPGIGFSEYRNLYYNNNNTQPFIITGDNIKLSYNGGKTDVFIDKSLSFIGFRIGAKASVEYKHFGAFVSFRPSWKEPLPCTSLSTGITIRY